jgi:DNA-binding GntR family transcriptional regulator
MSTVRSTRRPRTRYPEGGPPSASQAVADDLRESILRGELGGGTRVMQEEVATRLGVSQTIVREAFRELEVQGFLRAEPRRGVSVAELTLEDADELVRLRSAIEVQALAHALPRMTPEDLAAARDCLVELEAAEAPEEVIRLNAAFHDTLYRAAGLERTLALVRTLRLGFDRYFRLVSDANGHVPASQREHRQLLKLCERRDIEGAGALLHKHIVDTGKAVARRLRATRAL